MTTVLVNYATDDFADYQAINSLTGRLFGFDDCRSYGPDDLAPDFARRNAATLAAGRGAGYWLWKPYIVARTLAELADGDLLFYADAAMHFVNPVAPLVDLLDRHALDLLILGESFAEAQYTKRDAFVLMRADTPQFVGTPQRFASCFMLRKTAWADDFAARYLAFAEDDRILTDRANTCGLPDYSDFIAHRHDQSIFSLLSKQADVPVVAADMIAGGLPDRATQIINHTRAHLAPKDIVKRLLVQGVLSVSDLAELAAPA